MCIFAVNNIILYTTTYTLFDGHSILSFLTTTKGFVLFFYRFCAYDYHLLYQCFNRTERVFYK